MRLSLMVPNCMQIAALVQPWESRLTGPQIAEIAREAEQLGYTRIFVPEHVIVPRSHVPFSGAHWLHAAAAQGFFAGATSTIGIGSMLTVLPLHDPVHLAKQLATIDWLSGGRLQVTFGVGWLQEEFDLLGIPFSERGRRADDHLAAMSALWADDEPEHDGPFSAFRDVAFEPKPVQRPRPRVWIGGDSAAALRRVARYGDGWAPWQTTPDQIAVRLDELRALPGYDGRPLDVFYSRVAMNIGDEHKGLGRVTADGFDLQLTVDHCAQLAQAGVTETWIMPPTATDLSAYLDHVRWVAEEVAPRVRDL